MRVLKHCWFLVAAAFLLCRCATATPPAAYRLTLPYSSNAQMGSPASYSITFNLFNATPHTLSFAYAPYIEPKLLFQVDHKPPGDNPNTDSGWKAVKPIPQPVPKPSADDVVTEVVEHREKMVFTPGQEAKFSAPLGFSLAAPGFYRISLTMTMDAYEYEKPSDTKGRPRRLVLQSDHLVVAKTDWGFVGVTERP